MAERETAVTPKNCLPYSRLIDRRFPYPNLHPHATGGTRRRTANDYERVVGKLPVPNRIRRASPLYYFGAVWPMRRRTPLTVSARKRCQIEAI